MVDINYIYANILAGFQHIFTAPSRDLSILWFLTPIILFWLFLEIYFGRFKKEKLGWNSAMGNGLSIFWIVIISFRIIFADKPGYFTIGKFIFIIIIGLYAISIIYISFNHRIRKKIPFVFASPTVVYYLSAIAILWINNLIVISRWVMIDLVILFILVLIFEAILKKLIPEAASEPEIAIEQEINKDIEGSLEKVK